MPGKNGKPQMDTDEHGFNRRGRTQRFEAAFDYKDEDEDETALTHSLTFQFSAFCFLNFCFCIGCLSQFLLFEATLPQKLARSRRWVPHSVETEVFDLISASAFPISALYWVFFQFLLLTAFPLKLARSLRRLGCSRQPGNKNQ